jgi:O-antigen/teichoic acid export membrane protein
MSEVVSTGLVTRTRNHLSEPLFRNAYSLMVNSLLNAGLGLGFWVVAARIYPSEQVGRDSALVAAMVTLSTICQLNLGNAIPRFMPLVANPARALRKLYGVSIVFALVLSTVFVLLVPHLDEELDILSDPVLAISFVVGTSLWGVFALQDGALTGLRHAPWVPVENAAFGVLKLISLPLLFTLGFANGVFGSWLGPMLLLLIPVNALIFGRVIPAHRRAHPERSARLEDINRGQLTRFLAQDFGANAFFLGGVAILPLLILSILGSTENAYYYVALTIILGLEALVSNAGMSLTVESAFEGHRLRGLARVVFRRSLMLMVPCALLLIVAAPILLMPFGEDYVREGTPLLRILGVAVVFRTVILVFQAVARSRGRGRSLLVVDVVLFILLIGLTVALTPPFGLEGAGLAWLISNAVMALAVAPSLIRFLMSTHQPEIAFAPARAGGGIADAHALGSQTDAGLLALVTQAPGRAEGVDEPAEVVAGEEAEARPERRPPPPPLTVGPLWLLVIAAAACVASIGLMAAGAHGGVLTVALVLMLSLAPGAALLPFIGARDDALGLGLMLGTSLAISTIGAEIMLWTRWEPEAATYGLAAICLPAILLTLRARGFLPRSFREATGFDAVARVGRPSDGPLAKTLRRPTTQALILAAAAAAWILGMWTTDLGDISGWGLLTALGGAWYLGLLVLIVGYALTVWATPAIPGIFAAYITGLVLMLHGTTALLYDAPRYVWTYKHFGVVEEIMAQGHIDRSLDVYNNWPGFFALSAWLSESAGVEPITFAAWAQVFFSLAEVAALLFALRGLGVTERVRWTAAWLFVVADWIGQNYFAPQALAFLLSLVVLGLCLRCAPPREQRWMDRWLRRRRRRGPLLSWLAAVRKGVGLPDSAPPLPVRSALLVGTLVYVAVVVSHQLSPILLTAQVVAIALIGGRLPLWVPVAMLAIEVWWVSTTWSFVGDHFNLFDINPGAPAGGATDARNTGLPGVEVVFWAPRLLLIGVGALAAFGIVRLFRLALGARPQSRRPFDPVPVALAAAPIMVVGLQSYGGEGVLRASLFALPWLAALGAESCTPRVGPSRRSARECWRLIGVSAAVGTLMLLAYFGPEKRNHVTPADVAVSTWYEQNAPVGSVRAFLAPNAPLGLTANYASKRFYPDPEPSLTSLPAFRLHSLGPDDVPRIRALLLRQQGTERYFVISPSQENYSSLFKLLAPGSAQRLTLALRTSPYFQTVDHAGSAYVFRLVPPKAPAQQ